MELDRSLTIGDDENDENNPMVDAVKDSGRVVNRHKQ